MDQDILRNIDCFTKRCFEDYYGHFGGSPVIKTCDAKKLYQIRGVLGGSAHRVPTFCGRCERRASI